MPKIPFLKNIRSDLRKKKKIQEPVSISQKIYNSKQWKQLRNSYIKEFPLCQSCLEKGKITPAEQIHHRVPFLSGTTQAEIEVLAYDWDNLESLCKECHLEKHKKLGGYGNYSNL